MTLPVKLRARARRSSRSVWVPKDHDDGSCHGVVGGRNGPKPGHGGLFSDPPARPQPPALPSHPPQLLSPTRPPLAPLTNTSTRSPHPPASVGAQRAHLPPPPLFCPCDVSHGVLRLRLWQVESGCNTMINYLETKNRRRRPFGMAVVQPAGRKSETVRRRGDGLFIRQTTS